MKLKLLVLFVAILTVSPARAHAGNAIPVIPAGPFVTTTATGGQIRATSAPSGVTLSWVQSNSAGVNGNKVYRATCLAVTGTVQPDGAIIGTCAQPGTFAVIDTATTPIVTYTDSAVSPLTSYAYEVTATCTTCVPTESTTASNVIGVTTAPSGAPNPPTGLTLSASVSGTSQNVIAQWTDTSGTGMWFAFSDGNNFLAQGLIAPGPTTTFAQQWNGPVATSVVFVVCNATSACASQREM